MQKEVEKDRVGTKESSGSTENTKQYNTYEGDK